MKAIAPVNCIETQGFGNRPDFDPDYYAWWGYPGHNGRDYGCAAGTLGWAILDGTISKIAVEQGGFGQYVVQDVGDSLVYYCHLTLGGVLAAVGTKIKQGQQFYRTGYSGACWPKGEAGAHLHLGRRLKKYPAGDVWKGWRDPFEAAEWEAGSAGGSVETGMGTGQSAALAVPELPMVTTTEEVWKYIVLRATPEESGKILGKVGPGEIWSVYRVFVDAKGNSWYGVTRGLMTGWAAAIYQGATWLERVK